MTGVDLYKFIKPHLGSIDASGRHEVDIERLLNFKVYEELINCLIEDLDQSYCSSDNSYEDSVKRINGVTKKLIIEYYEWFSGYVSEWE